MKAVVITEGGSNIGSGHITRCLSLSQALEERGTTPRFIVNGDDSILDLLEGRDYQIFNWLEEKNRLFESVKDSDIAVIDSYLADISIYENLAGLVKTPLYIDDHKRLNYPRGVVVNGSLCAEELDYPRKSGISYLLGTKYIPIRKAFWDVPKKDIKESIEEIMITMGGADDLNFTPKILKMTADDFPKFTKYVIIGRGFKNIDKIKGVADPNTRLIYNPDADGMKEIMMKSDIAISGGGQTLYELARVGIPAIIICLAENQLNNIKGMQKNGFVQYAGCWNTENLLDEVKSRLRILRLRNTRQEISDIGRKLVDGKGARRVVEEGRLL